MLCVMLMNEREAGAGAGDRLDQPNNGKILLFAWTRKLMRNDVMMYVAF